MANDPLVWKGLAEAIPLPNSTIFGGNKAACVNAVALASSADDFSVMVREELLKIGLEMLTLEDVGVLDVNRPGSPPKLVELAAHLAAETPLLWGDFHTYPLDELREY
jgi:hypothetical protein